MVERVNIDHIADDLSRAYQDGYNAGYADFPAADVRPRWIPVSDRLPELHDAEYLDEITGKLIRYKESAPILIWLEKGGFMDIGFYEKSDAVDDFCYQGIPASVTYWMPLPEPPRKTHADRIRSMSDEELAEFILPITECGRCPTGETPCTGDSCRRTLLDWLRQEAET